jgi:hypothetical protein
MDSKSKKMCNVGINISTDVYEDTENALWVDGKVYSLGAVKLVPIDSQTSSSSKKENSWKINTKNGVINLTFTATVSKEEKVKGIVIESEFTQSCGRYSGEIRIDELHFKLTAWESLKITMLFGRLLFYSLDGISFIVRCTQHIRNSYLLCSHLLLLQHEVVIFHL